MIGAELLALKGMIVFLIGNLSYPISIVEYLVQEFVDCRFDKGILSECDLNEAKKVLRRVRSGQEDYFYKSFIYSEVKNYAVAYREVKGFLNKKGMKEYGKGRQG